VATKTINAKGLPCPQPALKMTIEALAMKPGEILEAVADCPSFEDDVRGWCNRTKKALLWMKTEPDGAKRCQVRI
jgi:tRNA 2-thiouridine synthesizing protein A